jgi:hypothetical protein
MCVQNFDDSRSPAIRITYRISLRSSSLREPRHPSLKVVYIHILGWGVPDATPKHRSGSSPISASVYMLWFGIGR